MPKTGRNDSCPCGSGKKYKHCCLEKDRAAELAPAIAQRVALQAQKANQVALRKDYQEELLESQATLQEAQALDAASNVVVDLVHAGRLDEAEQAARELLVRYPEVHDGYDRLGPWPGIPRAEHRATAARPSPRSDARGTPGAPSGRSPGR
ncbi:MAG TPA: SEC-C metal-binding domain-containing protein [Burkholderiaceae bacterium]|nr:SEC-C metal-binding domain-containing protein [Burkholderiaceae bacterium]